MLIKQSTSSRAIPFFMVSSTDHIAGKTGITPSVTISKNGGTFAAPAGAVSEVANGWYKIAGNATDSNTVGAFLVHATGTGADPFDITHEVVVCDIDSATVTVGTNNDKTGYSLVAAYDSAKTAASQANVATELTTYGGLKPTVAGRTLDIATTGEAGLDFNNVAGTIPDSAGVTTLLGRISSTLFTGITSLKEWLGLLAGKQSGNVTARTELRSTGVGSGTFDETTDSQEAIRDRGDASWITGAAAGDPWATLIPGAYGAGTAGNILGSRVDVAVSTRATQANLQTELNAYGALKPTTPGRTLDITTTGEAGLDFDNTIGTLSKGTDIIGFNDIPVGSAMTLTSAYDAAKVAAPVGAAMTLTSAYDAAKFAASQTSVNDVDTDTSAIKVVTDRLGTMLEVDGAVYRYTANALEQAPGGGGGGGTDPWLTLLPGAYAAGTAGNILGTNLDALVSSRLAAASYVTPPTKEVIALATRDIDNTSPAPPPNSLGAKINAAATAGDPWSTSLPGSYPTGSAGKIIGDRISMPRSPADWRPQRIQCRQQPPRMLPLPVT